MKLVFADTFYWAALTARGDPAHNQALEISRSIAPTKMITIEEVLAEYLTFFCGAMEHLRQEVVRNVEAILHDPTVRVIPQSHDSCMAGFELYRNRPDKGCSLTDCISMETMRRQGLTDVLTNDRHFEQEGFRALFRNF